MQSFTVCRVKYVILDKFQLMDCNARHAMTYADLRVLNKYQEVQSFSAFSSVFNDTGLFGIHLTTVSVF